MNLQEIVARNFRVILAERRMSKKTLFEKSGISRSSLTIIASGNSKGIQYETIEKIADALEIEPHQLFLKREGE